MKTSTWTLIATLCLVLPACGGQANDSDDLGNSAERDDNAEDEEEDAETGADESEEDAGAEGAATSDGEGSDDDTGKDDSSDGPTDVTPAPDTPSMMLPGTGVPTPPIPMPPSMTVDPPAEGCIDTSRSVGTNYCSTQQLCADNSYRYASCTDRGSGEWYCDCSTAQASGTYSLAGVDGDTACGAALDVCDTAPQPEFTEAPTCEIDNQAVSTAYCETSETCTQRAELSEGVAALSVGSSYVYCSDVGSGQLSCSCYSTDFNSRSYMITGLTTATACESEMTLCNADAQPVFSEEQVCQPLARSEGTNNCYLEQQCQRSAELANGIEVQSSEYQSSSCSQDSAGQWRCSCSGTSRSLAFLVEPTATGLAMCTDAQTLCSSTEEIVPEGEITCAPYSRSSSIGYCDALLECTQSATVGGTTLGLLGNMGASCSEISAGVWSCSCYASTSSQPFELQGTEAEDVCAEAVGSCPDRVELVIGAGGGVVGMPVPGKPILLK